MQLPTSTSCISKELKKLHIENPLNLSLSYLNINSLRSKFRVCNKLFVIVLTSLPTLLKLIIHFLKDSFILLIIINLTALTLVTKKKAY